jgi:preprotein translocase SecF subunit
LDKSIKDVGGHVTKLLQDAFKDAKLELLSVDEIGSMVGADLKRSGTWAVILSLCAILIYVGFRFEFGFGLGAIAALAHDALIALGLFSLCGRQVSLIVITAILTIIGYSVNDTVVVFDRIREKLRYDRKLPFSDLCNIAINSCLSRTVITSLTTFFAVLALFMFGDGSIFDFALVMVFGVVAGTYSSVFIAVPIMFWWYKGKRPDFERDERED